MSKANALRSLVLVSVLGIVLALWLGRLGIMAAGFVGVLITFGMLFDRANATSGSGPFPNTHVSYQPRPPLSEHTGPPHKETGKKKSAEIDLFWTVLVTGLSLILLFNRLII